MSSKAFVAGLFLFSASAFAADASFQLVKQDEKVSVYGKRPENCVSDGASVMFLVENRTKERLELKLELLNMKVKNKLTVMVEPSGNTSVLSLSPDPEACRTELVDMKVNPVLPKPVKTAIPAIAPSADPKPAEPAAAGDRVM
ncbi:MAG TPA: hypothetical protein VJ385_04935 [Fibrobacteria bacterium]|nr:hypothetical protein [Fibrobacteria bacterium]